MTVNGHWQYKLTILVHKFCVYMDDLRKVIFDLWQNGLKLMFQAIMQQSIYLNFFKWKYINEQLMTYFQPKWTIFCCKSNQIKDYKCTLTLETMNYKAFD